MNLIKIKKSQKGFTLIEVILVITLIGILIAIGLVSFNAEARFIDARNDIRKTHIQTLESAISQYKLQEGNYPTGLSRNYQEICDPEATDCTGFFNLKQFLVPTYLPSIPQDPNDEDTTGGTGYEVAIDTSTNTVGVRLKESLREGGVIIAVNDPLPAESTTTANSSLAATVPVTPPPPIVTNGLVLHLDAGNPSSYSGIGTTWRDLSGGDRNYTIGSGISWNNIGYFDVAGGSFIGPASNTFGFSTNNEHTIEVFARSNTTTANTFFYWAATPNTGSDQRAISTHLYSTYSGLTYYDVNGCCGTTRRISYSNDNDLSAGVRYLVWRNRSGTTPNRQFLKNLVSQMDSGANSTATVTWNRTDPASIGNGWSGDLYIFRVYNRALTDAEIQQNFNANRARFGL